MKVRLRVGKPIVKKEVFYVSIDQIEKQDRDEQKRISLIVKKLYERVLEDDPKSKIKKILVQFWLMSVAEQNLNGMNDRQIGKIKWNDKAFKRYEGFDKQTRMLGNRKIVHMDDVDKTLAEEYEKVPPNIAHDTLFGHFWGRFVYPAFPEPMSVV